MATSKKPTAKKNRTHLKDLKPRKSAKGGALAMEREVTIDFRAGKLI